MTSSEVRERFLLFFTEILKDRNLEHVEVPSSTLVPENHPTLLFTNSGMVQFTPYFLGEKDPVSDFGSKRLCSSQKSLRTGDIDIIGQSKYHLTFFEMLGSWSIGDYGKKEAIEIAFDLITNKKYGYGLDPDKLIATVFGGNDEVPADEESIKHWKSVGIKDSNISRLSASENWWAPAGLKGPGPCGPCIEILYDRGPEFGPEEEVPGMTDNPRYLEFWNAGVFMQFNRDASCKLSPLKKMSVDTGAGLERFTTLVNHKDSVYETDLFVPIIEKIRSFGLKSDNRESIRRVSDHIKASTFIIAENVFPSNKDQGYVLRKLLRRVFNDFRFVFDVDLKYTTELVPIVIDLYKTVYPEIDQVNSIISVINDEIEKYEKVAKQTKHIIKKQYVYKGKTEIDAFDLYQSSGASIALIKELAQESKLSVNDSNFDRKLEQHKKDSQLGAGKKFKGGLVSTGEVERKLHTATHLLHKALQVILGDHVEQKGSNINAERLRFDFSHPEKLTDTELMRVENLVNEKIKDKLPVNLVILPKNEAIKTGARHFFGEKYGENVKIYYIGESLEKSFSKEFCGGPHVKNTGDIGKFKIVKETAVGKGVRRIKAVVL